jgi:hypothetical protein
VSEREPDEVPAYLTGGKPFRCPQCNRLLIERIGGPWCPVCRGWLIESRPGGGPTQFWIGTVLS